MTDDLDREWQKLQRDDLIESNRKALLDAYDGSFACRLPTGGGRTVGGIVFPPRGDR